ncbi:uncharacterized protein [Dermacentor andersoni]|uniref:uncharacterized protein n=1 Tax=Dermacentor andersoni TaxID=34620 RepID=UPI003B3B1F54
MAIRPSLLRRYIVLFSRTFEAHLHYLEDILERLHSEPEESSDRRDPRLTAGLSEDEVRAILECPTPANIQALRRFLAELKLPDLNKEFVVQADASNLGIGAVLFQEHEEVLRPVAFSSQSLTPAERNYSVTEHHMALTWLKRLCEPSGCHVHWALTLQRYNFVVRYRKGSTNVVADALSRTPISDSDTFNRHPSETTLPNEAGALPMARTERVQAPMRPPIDSQLPWQIAACHVMKPFPRNRQGHTFLLAVTDHFTKWVELFHLRKLTACVIWDKLLEVFISFGFPAELITDNASYFMAKVFVDVWAAFGTKHRKTTTDHHQANPTERMNRFVKPLLAAFARQQRDWYACLCEIGFSLRTSVNCSAGYTPTLL